MSLIVNPYRTQKKTVPKNKLLEATRRLISRVVASARKPRKDSREAIRRGIMSHFRGL